MSIALAAAPLAITQPTAAAMLSSWTDPAAVSGSSAWADLASATAPNGATAIAWLEPGLAAEGTTQISATVRRAGSDSWVEIPVTIDADVAAGSLDLTAAPNGNFWVGWVSETDDGDVAYVMRLSTAKQHWMKPIAVFDGASTSGEGPVLAASGDGTITVAAAADVDAVPSVVVATRAADHTWSQDSFATIGLVAVDATDGTAGRQLVSWTDVDNDVSPSVTTLQTAARSDASGEWVTRTVAGADDAYPRITSAIGADGLAVVGWLSAYDTTSGAMPTAVSAATLDLDDPDAAWSSPQALIDDEGATRAFNLRAVIDRNDVITVVWTRWDLTDGDLATEVMARTLTADTLGEPVTIPTGGPSVAAVPRPGGGLDIVYSHTSSDDDEGLWVVSLVDGELGSPTSVSGGLGNPAVEASEGWEFGLAARLGTSAAGGLSLVWGRGDDGGIVQERQTTSRPLALTSADSAVELTSATITGQLKVGQWVTCASGFWVESSNLTYRWFRDGKMLATQVRRAHLLREAASGADFTCQAIASNEAGGKRTLTSASRRVRQQG